MIGRGGGDILDRALRLLSNNQTDHYKVTFFMISVRKEQEFFNVSESREEAAHRKSETDKALRID